jgi:hypothetical protein
VIPTLLITIAAEGVVVVAYAVWRRKPLISLLLTSIFANLVTQSVLRIALVLSFRNYLTTLAIAEIGIWLLEGLILYGIPSNKLKFSEALLLSLAMNLTSLALGWFLPV